MATPEQIAKGPHRNDVLLQDSEELHHRLEDCDAAQKALRAHLGRIRLLFGPNSPASLETDKVIRAVRDTLTTATKYYEKVEENPQDILVISRKYSSRFVTRREDAWASFNVCDQAREEMGYKTATSTAEPGGGFTFTVLSS
jgi:hypothetical protein